MLAMNSPGTTLSSTAASSQTSPRPVYYHDAPEVVPESLPEHISTSQIPAEKIHVNKPPGSSYSAAATTAPPGYQAGSVGAGYTEALGGSAQQRTWWKRKRVWVTALVALLAIIGLVVGLVVSLTNRNNNGDDSSSEEGSEDNSSSTVSSCEAADGGICPPILTFAIFEGETYFFARSADNTIQYTVSDGTSFDGSTWEDIDETRGTLISQPSVIAWTPVVADGDPESSPRLDVFALSSSERSVYGIHRQDGAWSEWEHFGGNAASPVAVCSPFEGRIDLWVADADTANVTHNWWLDDVDEPVFYSGGGGGGGTEVVDWQTQSPGVGPVSGSLSVVCRDSNDQHDVVYYDREGGDAPVLRHQRWQYNQRSWTDPADFRASDAVGLASDGQYDFAGDPSIFSFPNDPEHVDIFGVLASEDGSRHEAFHLAWSSSDGYSDVQALSGINVASVPSVVTIGDGVLEAVALERSRGTLHHIRYDDGWGDEWENLELESGSAPLVIVRDGRVVIFYVRPDGGLGVANVPDDAEAGRWREAMETGEEDGDLSLEYYVPE